MATTPANVSSTAPFSNISNDFFSIYRYRSSRNKWMNRMKESHPDSKLCVYSNKVGSRYRGFEHPCSFDCFARDKGNVSRKMPKVSSIHVFISGALSRNISSQTCQTHGGHNEGKKLSNSFTLNDLSNCRKRNQPIFIFDSILFDLNAQ